MTTIDKATLNDLYAVFAQKAVRFFNEKGEHPPTIFMVNVGTGGKDHTATLMPPEFTLAFFTAESREQAAMQKEKLGAVIRSLLAPNDEARALMAARGLTPPDIVLMVTEAWMVKEKLPSGSTVDLANSVPPSEHPERCEAIMISLHTAEGSAGGMCEILENPRRAEFSAQMEMLETRFSVQPTAH